MADDEPKKPTHRSVYTQDPRGPRHTMHIPVRDDDEVKNPVAEQVLARRGPVEPIPALTTVSIDEEALTTVSIDEEDLKKAMDPNRPLRTWEMGAAGAFLEAQIAEERIAEIESKHRAEIARVQAKHDAMVGALRELQHDLGSAQRALAIVREGNENMAEMGRLREALDAMTERDVALARVKTLEGAIDRLLEYPLHRAVRRADMRATIRDRRGLVDGEAALPEEIALERVSREEWVPYSMLAEVWQEGFDAAYYDEGSSHVPNPYRKRTTTDGEGD